MVQGQPLEVLRERFNHLFEYNKDTGDLIRKITTGGRAVKGQIIRSPNNQGYYRVYVDGKRYLVHRVVFLMNHGYLPEMIDHINMDKQDNRLENLREATKDLNMINRGLFSNNTSGASGVSFHNGKWRARISEYGEERYLGKYETFEEAKKVYDREKSKRI